MAGNLVGQPCQTFLQSEEDEDAYFPDIGPTGWQSLTKGDVVFALSDDYEEIPSWTNLFRRQNSQKETKFTTGIVTLKKERRDSHFYLAIKWENGKFERLTETFRAGHVALGQRLFVLDRECLGVESQVTLCGHSDVKGTVKEKKYLVTGKCTEDKDVIFEDIDVSLLRMHSHGSAYRTVKIMYDGWLGITFDYKTRLHIKPVKDQTSFSSSTYLVMNGVDAQNYNVGDNITLGFNLLRKGRLMGDNEIDSSHWLLNAFRYLNTEAIITDIQLEELHVNWIGKSEEPDVCPASFVFPDAPPVIIPSHEIKYVQFLTPAKQFQVTPKSLWKYTHNPVVKEDEDAPISRGKWIGKWFKLVDLDRWVYPIPADIPGKEKFWDRALTLEVMYVRSVVVVEWENGITNTVNAGDVIPANIGTVWDDWAHFRNGSIVKDRLHGGGGDKYGVILKMNNDETARVNWIQLEQPGTEGDFITTETANIPLFDLQENTNYDFILKLEQSPIVFPSDASFAAGVVVGMSLNNGQIRVKVPGERERLIWPHQLIHYKCDVMKCPLEGCWVAYYDHITSPEELSQTSPIKKNKEDFSSILSNLNLNKRGLTVHADVPEDNVFRNEIASSTPLDLKYFHNAVDNELREIDECLPLGIWIEYYSRPGNVLSALITGPPGTLFQDMLFIFDIILMEDYPGSDPHINFRSMGFTIFPEHFCKTGTVVLPEECNLAARELTKSDILNSLLQITGFMGVPLDVIYEMEWKEEDSKQQSLVQNSDELYKFVLVSVLDYTIALLRNMPENWEPAIISHYAEALPRIIDRLEKSQEENSSSINEEQGDLLKIDNVFSTSRPLSKAYIESIRERIGELNKINERIAISN